MLSLIIPVYLNEASLPSLIDVVTNIDTKLQGELEVIFVVDGSPDHSYDFLLDKLPNQNFNSQLILLSKNFGSFMAIRTGLSHGKGDTFAVMAADLQEPPSLIITINETLKLEPIDVVIGVRDSRQDPFFSKFSANIFWHFYRRYIVPEMPVGGVDIFGCNKAFRDTLLTLEERHSSLIAQIFWLGFRRKTVNYTRVARAYGKSAWTMRKKINYLMDSIFSFTDLPIRLLTRIGSVGSILSICYGASVIFARMVGLIDVPGYAMTLFSITLLGSVNLLGLGIIGSYAWRTYENTKARPLAIPMKKITFNRS
ncbi:glycosyltransferase family 2 protein [Aeromonas jandaei]|uniref:glycosyltransferase family 2 protein n=1 Tax=Aeromonas jandaei TaxID=650 RepID=UPI0009DF6D0C|nr:glycosyltransferase family 2 protein [Aeromonas jandaei]